MKEGFGEESAKAPARLDAWLPYGMGCGRSRLFNDKCHARLKLKVWRSMLTKDAASARLTARKTHVVRVSRGTSHGSPWRGLASVPRSPVWHYHNAFVLCAERFQPQRQVGSWQDSDSSFEECCVPAAGESYCSRLMNASLVIFGSHSLTTRTMVPLQLSPYWFCNLERVYYGSACYVYVS